MFEIYFILFHYWGCSKFLHLKVHTASEPMEIIHIFIFAWLFSFVSCICTIIILSLLHVISMNNEFVLTKSPSGHQQLEVPEASVGRI